MTGGPSSSIATGCSTDHSMNGSRHVQCRICRNEEGDRTFDVPEMMYGLGETIPYVHCAACGCLQIAHYPADIEKFYGAGYSSYRGKENRTLFERWRQKRIDRYEITGRGRVGRYFSERGRNTLLHDLAPALANRRQRILEIGCGSGDLLHSLHDIGYRNLTGADPFIDAEIRVDDRFVIYKKELAQVEGQFDLIMFHHSLEHLPDQHAIFRQVAERLAPGGRCVVRVPLASSFAFDEYGVDWVQLDAPRHDYLHTAESLRRLAVDAGLRLTDSVHDSTAFQFWGSEQYRRGIPLRDPRSFAECKVADSIFTRGQIGEFRRKAAELNAAQRGDQAVFFIEAPRIRAEAREP